MDSQTGIHKRVLLQIIDLAGTYGIERVLLFGSRARGDYKRTSDIDLAVYGGNVAGFALAVDEETDTLLEFDVVDLSNEVQEELKKEIDRDGVLIYEKI